MEIVLLLLFLLLIMGWRRESELEARGGRKAKHRFVACVMRGTKNSIKRVQDLLLIVRQGMLH